MLRLLTPQDTCRPLDIYPVKLTQDAIYVDVGAAASSRAYQTTRGGADSSIERNNVYALQPKSYIQGQDPSGNKASMHVCIHGMPAEQVTVHHRVHSPPCGSQHGSLGLSEVLHGKFVGGGGGGGIKWGHMHVSMYAA